MSRRRPARTAMVDQHSWPTENHFRGDGADGDVVAHPHLDRSPAVDALGCLIEPVHPAVRSADTQQGHVAWVASLLAGAVDAMTGVDHGSVAEWSAEGAQIWAATAPVAEELDRRGAEWGEGPGADALRERAPAGTLTITPLDRVTARRWPRWSALAHTAGVGATLSIVLPGGPGKRPPVLALHGPHPAVFGAATVSTARTFAAPLAVAVHAASRVTGLEQALETRDVIGQAKGLLMAHHRVDADTAFAHLVAISQRRNVRLTEVATRIVEGCQRRRDGVGEPVVEPSAADRSRSAWASTASSSGRS